MTHSDEAGANRIGPRRDGQHNILFMLLSFALLSGCDWRGTFPLTVQDVARLEVSVRGPCEHELVTVRGMVVHSAYRVRDQALREAEGEMGIIITAERTRGSGPNYFDTTIHSNPSIANIYFGEERTLIWHREKLSGVCRYYRNSRLVPFNEPSSLEALDQGPANR